MSEIKKLKVDLPSDDRVETGPIQFNDDWPGFFIRGDNAFAIRMAIAAYIVNPNDWVAKMQLRAFVEELDSCNVNKNLVQSLQEGNRGKMAGPNSGA